MHDKRIKTESQRRRKKIWNNSDLRRGASHEMQYSHSPIRNFEGKTNRIDAHQTICVDSFFFYTCSVHLCYRFTLHSSLTNFSCASAWCSCHIVITFIYVDRTCLCSSFDWDCMAHSLFYSRPVCSLVHCLALTLSAVAFIVSNSWLLLSTTNDYFNSLLVSSWREKARDR